MWLKGRGPQGVHPSACSPGDRMPPAGLLQGENAARSVQHSHLCAGCEPVSSLPLPGLTGFLHCDHRTEFQRLSEENLVLRSDLGRIQLELETSESRNETQR